MDILLALNIKFKEKNSVVGYKFFFPLSNSDKFHLNNLKKTRTENRLNVKKIATI